PGRRPVGRRAARAWGARWRAPWPGRFAGSRLAAPAVKPMASQSAWVLVAGSPRALREAGAHARARDPAPPPPPRAATIGPAHGRASQGVGREGSRRP